MLLLLFTTIVLGFSYSTDENIKELSARMDSALVIPFEFCGKARVAKVTLMSITDEKIEEIVVRRAFSKVAALSETAVKSLHKCGTMYHHRNSDLTIVLMGHRAINGLKEGDKLDISNSLYGSYVYGGNQTALIKISDMKGLELEVDRLKFLEFVIGHELGHHFYEVYSLSIDFEGTEKFVGRYIESGITKYLEVGFAR